MPERGATRIAVRSPVRTTTHLDLERLIVQLVRHALPWRRRKCIKRVDIERKESKSVEHSAIVGAMIRHFERFFYSSWRHPHESIRRISTHASRLSIVELCCALHNLTLDGRGLPTDERNHTPFGGRG